MVVVLIGVTGLLPSAVESHELPYLVMHYGASVLVICSGFAPTTSGTLGFVLFALFTTLYPALLNPFTTVGEAATAVLLSNRLLWRFTTFTMILFMLPVLRFAPSEVADSGTFGAYVSMLFGWTLGAILGLTASGFESRVHQEIRRRETTVREAERTLFETRRRFAIDAHDTVSHGLAAQAAIIKMLGARTPPSPSGDEQLAELALVNAQTQFQLRRLLARLTGKVREQQSPVPFDREFRTALESLLTATEAGGFHFKISVASLPAWAPADVLEGTLYALQELITNVVKHSNSREGCTLRVNSTRHAGMTWLTIRSINVVEADLDMRETPRTLSMRVAQMGGTCNVSTESPGRLQVEVGIPLTA
ncbi:sensor histidine kinase [Arthrobacter sp. B2a2-09]|uniref:sensor histidine kinase n=1 Tax=Arthrobacter sp. B2a2-09 TaxID=2952822 RepID=UPI0022CD5242|nr:histidine kinase [Arthrobacter sp. B2a2-09]MCZ9884951.1 histidine kinase [Arthrobacter sp. B2a2-09]